MIKTMILSATLSSVLSMGAISQAEQVIAETKALTQQSAQVATMSSAEIVAFYSRQTRN